jgi:sulfoxide reductase heme-binding subunit YedZ
MTLWYATRAFGIVSILLLSAVLALGVITAGRRAVPSRYRFVITGLHRTLALTGVAFVAVHVVAAITDGYVALTWLDAVVPFGSAYRPLWTGLGTVSLDLMILLIGTSLLRSRIGWRTWRTIHWAAYAFWPVAVLHGLGQGTDANSALFLLPALLGLSTVAGAALWRLTRSNPRPVAGRV